MPALPGRTKETDPVLGTGQNPYPKRPPLQAPRSPLPSSWPQAENVAPLA